MVMLKSDDGVSRELANKATESPYVANISTACFRTEALYLGRLILVRSVLVQKPIE